MAAQMRMERRQDLVLIALSIAAAQDGSAVTRPEPSDRYRKVKTLKIERGGFMRD